MESGSDQIVHDVNYISEDVAPASKETSGEVYTEASVSADDIMRAGGFGTTDDITSLLPVATDATHFEAQIRDIQNNEKEDVSGEVNMEASVTSDDVTRAGGFGATDDISSFLPVASDFTDFEAHIRDARGYEDSKEEINHPGLGWSNEKK